MLLHINICEKYLKFSYGNFSIHSAFIYLLIIHSINKLDFRNIVLDAISKINICFHFKHYYVYGLNAHILI